MLQKPQAFSRYRALMLHITLCAISTLAGAQTDTAASLITVIPSAHQDIASSAATSNTLAAAVFPRTSAAAAQGSTQTIRFRLNKSVSISGLSFSKSEEGREEFKVLGTSGCNTDGQYTNYAGSVCSVTVQFTPAYPGVRTMPLKITTSVGVVSLASTGMGVAPLAVLSPGIITTIAGSGSSTESGDGGPATQAGFYNPISTAIDSAGNIYVSTGGFVIRKIDATTGIISTIAGNGIYDITGDGGAATSASVGVPQSMSVGPDGALYVLCGSNSAYELRKIDLVIGIITKVAGNGTATYSGDGGLATSAGIDGYSMGLDASGNIYLTSGYRIRKIDGSTGIISTIGGTGVSGYSGDGGPATSAALIPMYLAVSSAGDVYFSDQGKAVIRKIDASSGVITKFAGTGTAGYSGDGGQAGSAQIQVWCNPSVDPAGQVYLSDMLNYNVRKIDLSGVITTIAGTGISGFSGDGGLSTSAQFKFNYDAKMDSAGNLIIVDQGNYRIRKISGSASAINFKTETTAGVTDTADGPLSVTLSNGGNAALTIASFAAQPNPSISIQDFIYSTAATCPQVTAGGATATLAAGASCTLATEFTPSAAGSLTGNLVVTDDSANTAASQQTVVLTGTASSSNADKTTTTVSALSTTPYVSTQSITFTATVKDIADATFSPVGTVLFTVYKGSTLLSTSAAVPVAGGQATYIYTASTTGSLTVKASYTSGNTGVYVSSADSTGQNFTVVGDYQVAIPSSSTTNIGITVSGGITASQNGPPASVIFTVTPGTGGLPGDLALSASGLPSGVIVSFSPKTIAQGTSTTTGTLTIDLSQANLAGNTRQNVPFEKSVPVLAGFLLIAGLGWRKRRISAPFLLAALLAITCTMTGCLQSTAPHTSSYTLVITASSGSTQRTASVPFTISY